MRCRAGLPPRVRRALASAALLLVQGCVTSDETYVGAVRQLIARGPEAACCAARWEGPGRAADEERCRREAPARCAFVRGASVHPVKIERFGHDDGAVVEVVVSGPAGAGRCTHQVLSYPRGDVHVDGGHCTAP
jgi:hypothetical protein